ncbi:hypothetical protein ACFQ1M_04580 [Sungkyunkwania multivorans]|uniref:AMMECR1 domain-containing protein n=1 Tax=Sungkyunkwania multivorans TaxID=1173618 RepID=A0ABW3CUM3_9FLAO
MKLRDSLMALFFLSLLGCNSNATEGIEPEDDPLIITERLNYDQLIEKIGIGRLASIVEIPNAEGALGRNKDGYFHVRFQLAMTTISDYAVTAKSTEALTEFLRAVNYSFERQLESGDFEISIPPHIANISGFVPPSAEDLTSGTAFFASSLGISLVSLSRSDWFMNSDETLNFRTQLEQYQSEIELLLNYLISSESILKDYDQSAPNRLLYDALGYFTLGKYLDRQDAMNLGIEFLNLALALSHPEEGYFIENNGWDSSYNGVALQLGFELLSLMEYENTSQMESTLLASASWQISRILNSGEISTEGNTRVFPGGESFLGQEKRVDYAKTIRTLLYLKSLTNKDELAVLAEKVLNFYN